MQCERLIGLAKSWYLNVRNETMAPARMVSFIKNHVAQCGICQADPNIQDEIVKITEIVLPKSKIPKALRVKDDMDDETDQMDDDYDSDTDHDDESDNDESGDSDDYDSDDDIDDMDDDMDMSDDDDI